MTDTTMTSAEQALRLVSIARALDIPTGDLLDALQWFNGWTDKRPAWVPAPRGLPAPAPRGEP